MSSYSKGCFRCGDDKPGIDLRKTWIGVEGRAIRHAHKLCKRCRDNLVDQFFLFLCEKQ